MNDLARAQRIADIRSRRGSPERSAAIARLTAPTPPAAAVLCRRRPGVISEGALSQLRADLDTACRDAAADFGDEIVEAGGYADLAVSVIAMHPECSPATIAEFKRIEGI